MLTLDIETGSDKRLLEIYLLNIKAPKNYKDEDKIKEYLEAKKLEAEKALSIDPDYNDIKCIGIKENEEPARLVKFSELNSLFEKHKMIITFNGKNFDIPTIIKYGVKNRVNLPYRDLRVYQKKWTSGQHVDLMEVISDGRDYKSLDEYLQIYLGIKKTPIDFITCTQEELEAHCLEDIENTYKLYKLFEISI